ncbi:MAG: RnfABCDGE type electron transport complex subunit D [Angelakisella sp.]|nr:RnfABCDGE type electron transport complex subunit D [Angelakisella sp.]
MANHLIVTPSPHMKDGATTGSIMMNVAAALVPAAIVSVLVFGLKALVLLCVCVASCVFFEYIFRLITKRSNTISDFSAVVTGILIAFNLPVDMPIWMAVFGCAVAILVVKQLFGGIGENFANPAIVARIVLLISFSTQMTTWAAPKAYVDVAEAVSGATPLAILTNGGKLAEVPPMINFLLGVRGGCLGETCAIALLIGGIYLIWKKVITATIPVTILATVVVMSLLTGLNPVYQVVSGGVLLGAFFMATDYVTSPTSEVGKLIFGIGIGVITMLIRAYGSYPEGMSFAILIMNIVAPHIDRSIKKMPFGGVSK